jgi:hypothetical protein
MANPNWKNGAAMVARLDLDFSFAAPVFSVLFLASLCLVFLLFTFGQFVWPPVEFLCDPHG